MITLVKNLKCILRLNIHPNRRYKPSITSLKAIIVGKSLISAGLDIDRILHFVSYGKILQICRQHWVKKFSPNILSKYQQIPKKCMSGERGVLHPATHSPSQYNLTKDSYYGAPTFEWHKLYSAPN